MAAATEKVDRAPGTAEAVAALEATAAAAGAERAEKGEKEAATAATAAVAAALGATVAAVGAYSAEALSGCALAGLLEDSQQTRARRGEGASREAPCSSV